MQPHKGCGCDDTARWMDQLGADGCEQKLDLIVNRLEDEAANAENHVPLPARGGEEDGSLGDPAGEEGHVVGRGRRCEWLGEWARFLAGGEGCPHWGAG
jgi:hypothetical protein